MSYTLNTRVRPQLLSCCKGGSQSSRSVTYELNSRYSIPSSSTRLTVEIPTATPVIPVMYTVRGCLGRVEREFNKESGASRLAPVVPAPAVPAIALDVIKLCEVLRVDFVSWSSSRRI